MNTLIQERHNHSESCITVKVSQRTQQFEIYLASEGSSLAFFSTDLSEYNIVDDTKDPLLRCFLFVSKLKAGDIIATGQHMNYRTFSNCN